MGLMRWDMHLAKLAHNVRAPPERQGKASRREFFGAAVALAASPDTMPACDDPIIALIAAERRWRLAAMAARAKAEKSLFALPKDAWPEEFDDDPIMAEALLLEKRADEVYERIVSTSARTLKGIFAKLDWGERDVDITEAAIADLRHWLRAR